MQRLTKLKKSHKTGSLTEHTTRMFLPQRLVVHVTSSDVTFGRSQQFTDTFLAVILFDKSQVGAGLRLSRHYLRLLEVLVLFSGCFLCFQRRKSAVSLLY